MTRRGDGWIPAFAGMTKRGDDKEGGWQGGGMTRRGDGKEGGWQRA